MKMQKPCSNKDYNINIPQHISILPSFMKKPEEMMAQQPVETQNPQGKMVSQITGQGPLASLMRG